MAMIRDRLLRSAAKETKIPLIPYMSEKAKPPSKPSCQSASENSLWIDGRRMARMLRSMFARTKTAVRMNNVVQGRRPGGCRTDGQIGRASCRERVCQYV